MALVNTGLDPDLALYIEGFVNEPLEVLRELREHIAENCPQIQISRIQGRFLEVLIRATKSKRVLEIGTFLGYSTIWMGYAAGQGGAIDTIELDAGYSKEAAYWIERAGLQSQVRIHKGKGRETVSSLPNNHYDFVFIDADKCGYPHYLEEAIRCSKLGGVIVADNTLYKGRVLQVLADKPQTRAIRAYNEEAFKHPKLATTLIPLGDGFTISLRLQ